MDDIDPKTERKLVVDALENVLRDLWYEETPYYDHETIQKSFGNSVRVSCIRY